MKIRIYEKYDNIRMYLKDLEEFNIASIEELDNKLKYYSSSMIAFNTLNDFFVLADEALDILDLKIAQTYRDIFKILKDSNVISNSDFKFVTNIVTLRNKLAHEYDSIEKEELFELLQDLPQIEKLAKKILDKTK